MPIVEISDFETGDWRAGFSFGGSHPFADDGILEFLAELSKTILNDAEARRHPDLVTFGYFCRKANLKRALEHIPSPNHRFGWGTVVHIAPANIPLNFAFSFVMGLLSGNSNIVRLPSRPFVQTELCVALIDRLLSQPKFRDLAQETAFVRTEHNSAVLLDLVAHASGLVVWGGDKTVKRFKELSKLPACVELGFPDRVSSLLVDADTYNAMSDEEAQKSARRFYNDTMIVDQNACSSPSTVFWLGGDDDIEQAKNRFWRMLHPILEAEYAMDPVARINRNLDLLRDVAEAGHALDLDTGHDIWRLTDADILNLPRRFGTFLELGCRQVEDIRPYLRINEQTLTTLGIAPSTVFEKLSSGRQPVSVDRIVPVGQALDIGFVWDGKEVLSILSRRVQVS
ncbi:MAG: acyl-CoA reductase [Pseudomonadota bacterium]